MLASDSKWFLSKTTQRKDKEEEKTPSLDRDAGGSASKERDSEAVSSPIPGDGCNVAMNAAADNIVQGNRENDAECVGWYHPSFEFAAMQDTAHSTLGGIFCSDDEDDDCDDDYYEEFWEEETLDSTFLEDEEISWEEEMIEEVILEDDDDGGNDGEEEEKEEAIVE